MKEINKTVILLRGCPNSGKSTIAELLCLNREDAIICCADDYYTDEWGGYHFDPSKIGQAHKACQGKFLNALTNPEINLIVVANTNSQRFEINFYQEHTIDEGYRFSSIVVERRNHMEDNGHNVPREIINTCRDRIIGTLSV